MSKHNYVFGAFQSWLVSLARLGTALVGILSLGFYIPQWDSDLMAHFLLKFSHDWTAKEKARRINA